MAQAAVLTLNAFPTGVENTQHLITYRGLVTFTGSGGYTTGGVPLDWTKMVGPEGGIVALSVGPATTKPYQADFIVLDGSLVSYNYSQVANTLFAIAAGVQLASTTTLSGLIAFEAKFARGI